MRDPIAEKRKEESNLKIARIAGWTLFGMVAVFFGSISGCVMYSETFEAEQTRAKVGVIQAQTQIAREQNEAIIKLIEKGTNPIAARCAILGAEGDSICAIFIDDTKEELR